MNLFGLEIGRAKSAPAEGRALVEDPRVPLTGLAFMEFFGIAKGNLPAVTIDSALKVPAVAAAVAFQSRSLASLPIHAFTNKGDGPKKIDGKLEIIVHENPNPYQDSFKFRQYFWQQVFTGGRGLAWIERNSQNVEALWPIDPVGTTVSRRNSRVFYTFENKEYPAEDVIDVPFMLRHDMLSHYGPIALAEKSIQLALAMNDYASGFFAGGGVPPLALVGPLPSGKEAIARAVAQTKQAIDNARDSATPIFPMPPGYELKPIGFDPEKGQMTDARRFQVEEIARGWQMPPMFLQDLTKANFANSEQQDLHLVKHNIRHWALALEGEMNLKLFGRMKNSRYVEHNLDGLMRGDFLSRLQGLGQAVQNAILSPNEARALENRPRADEPAADKLHIQGATVPLGTTPGSAPPAAATHPVTPT